MHLKTEYDAKEDEAYRRLTTGTLYRAMDNVTTMKAARDFIPSLGPSSFKISLGFCNNYKGREAGKLYNTIMLERLMLPSLLKMLLKAHGSLQHVPTPQSFICCGIRQAIGNTLNNFATSWMDIYSTTIYSMIANSVIPRSNL